MSGRSLCSGCGRPQVVCLCAALSVQDSRIRLIIWQDPTESRHPLSTAPLLQRSIRGSRLLVGERFSEADIFGAGPATGRALLYPLAGKAALAEQEYAAVSQLLVLDGTWRKVRKLLLQNPWLQQLPHLQLLPQQKSRYAIRTSPRNDGLSTLEAGVMALNTLQQTQRFDRCLAVLDQLVAQQQSFGHKQ